MAPAARIGVVGAGLIGGSIAKAAVSRRPAGPAEVVVYDRDGQTRADLAAAGLEVADDLAALARAVDIAVVAVPPAATAAVACELLAAAPALVVTDTASVKASVCAAVAARASGSQLARFVPGHPLAGHQARGWRHADAGILEGSMWALCPQPGRTDLHAALRVIATVTGVLGARVLPVDPGDHDVALAHTSHMPHLVASALMRTAAADAAALRMRLSGGALRDGTRVAEADAELWTEILSDNAGNVTDALDALIADLGAVRERLAAGRTDELADAWRLGASLRADLGRLRWSATGDDVATVAASSVDGLLGVGRGGGLIVDVAADGDGAPILSVAGG